MDVQCIETFQQLLKELIGKINLSRMEILQEMLSVLKRKDLINIALEYRNTVTSDSKDMYAGSDNEQITLRIEHLSYSKGHVRELVQKLSDLLFAPINKITINRIEEMNSGGYICVLELPSTHAELLQELYESDDKETGLNCFGITDIYIRSVAYKIKGKMVPVEMLHQHQHVIAILKEQNDEFMQRLDKLSASLDSLLPLVTELGDPKTHMKNLSNLHKHSGMSTTIWKILGKLTDDQLPERYRPDFSQEEIRQKCLYSKARLQRVFPHLSMPLQKKPENYKGSQY